MNLREWNAARSRAWDDMTGCTCKRVIRVHGKSVTLRPDELCSRRVIRCNGRANRWQRDLKKIGPKPEPKAVS